MSLSSPKRLWLRRHLWFFIIGAPLVGFALGPFPGLGMIYRITDSLRGHPQGPHGTQPARFTGLWVRDESVLYDFLGQAFYLMPDGRFAGMRGMTERRWHFDANRLFIDAVSRCGNCYAGNVTTELKIVFKGDDEMTVIDGSVISQRGIVGRYRRFEITDHLRLDLTLLAESTDEEESFKARCVLRAIKDSESLSKFEG